MPGTSEATMTPLTLWSYWLPVLFRSSSIYWSHWHSQAHEVTWAYVPGGASVEKIFKIDYQDGPFNITSLHMYRQGSNLHSYTCIGGASSELALLNAHKLYCIIQWNIRSWSEYTGCELLSQYRVILRFLSELAWSQNVRWSWVTRITCSNSQFYLHGPATSGEICKNFSLCSTG